MIILEVGCATGVATEMAANSLLNDGSMLVSCDFSGEMCKLFNERLQKSDFKLVPGNCFEMDTEINYVSSENSTIDIQKIRKGNKFVFGC
jgi:ubiquinone/menaquinone biosynthesis C-methylase UbiE